MKWKVQRSGTMEDKLMGVDRTQKWQLKLNFLKAHHTWNRELKQTASAMKWRHTNLSSSQNLL